MPYRFGFGAPCLEADLYGDVLAGFLAGLERSKYETSIFVHGEDPARFENAIESLTANGARAIAVVVPRSYNHAQMKLLQTCPIPIVLIGRQVPELATDQVVIDNVAVGEQATSYLLHMGHRHIAHLGQLDYQVGRDRLTGYQRALQRFGITYEQELVVDLTTYPSLTEAAATAVYNLLNKKVRFTAITAFNDEEAIHAIQALQRHGYGVPDDVSVVGVDNHPILRGLRPALTTVAIDWHGMGRWAAGHLLSADLSTRTKSGKTLFSPLQVISRDTCRFV